MLTLQVDKGLTITTPETKSTLPYTDLWDKDEDEDEEIVSPPIMGMREPIIVEDPSLTMEDILDLHPEGHQTNVGWQRLSKGRELN